MKLLSMDIETLIECYLIVIKDYETGKVHKFTVTRWQNDLYKLAKFCEGLGDYYWIGFNNLNFDAQVVEWILRNYQRWGELSNLDITYRIWQKAQDIISDINNGKFPPYREEDLSFKVIDIFKIHHFDNESKRTSLKWLEFMMDMENIEDMPIKHDKRGMTQEEVNHIISYCDNDVDSTDEGYKYTIGDVSNKEYKGKNKVQDRLGLIAAGLLPWKAMNYSDSKIGDELNKIAYCKLTGCKPEDLIRMKRERGATKKFTYGEAIPPYVQFKTPEFRAFYERISKVKVSLVQDDKQEFPITFRGTTYSIMRGGIHSTEKNRIIIPRPNEFLRDADVGSQYPNAILKRKLFPKHLGIAWNQVGAQNIDNKAFYKERVKNEELSEAERDSAKGLEGMYKLALNSGYFGKTLEPTNWQYAPEVGYYCTIGNQFEILMLIEMLELAGIHCVSANTDGIVCLFPETLDKTYYEICHEWERVVGNDKLGKLDYTDFKLLAQESINHYVAIKKDGKTKVKGRFCYDVELNKNNSDKLGRIERIAIVDYFCRGIPIEKTIEECDNIFLFCIGAKSSREYNHKELNFQTAEVLNEYNRVLRYYVANEGNRLVKTKRPGSEAPGADLTKVAGDFKVRVVQSLPPASKEGHLENVNRQHYIDKAKKLVEKIEKNRKKGKEIIINPNQINLF